MIHEVVVSFNAGELSPLMDARTAVEKYAAGCRQLRNFIIHTHGPVFRRPGMQYLGNAASDAVRSRLFEFVFSNTTAFVIEMALGELFFWSNGMLVPLDDEVEHPYLENEFYEVQARQINDVVYFTHPNHPPQKLIRKSDTNWVMTEMPFDYPPLRDQYVEKPGLSNTIVTPLLTRNAEEWPEFTTSGAYTFSILGAASSATSKTARLQKWTGTAWSTIRTLGPWTTTPPADLTGTLVNAVYRLTYTGDVIAASSVNLDMGGTGFLIAMSDAQPYTQNPATVATGDYLAKLICAPTLPSGTIKAELQKLVGATWTLVHKFTPVAGSTLSFSGTVAAATSMRMKWTGRAMVGGTMVISQVTYAAASTVIKLAVSDTSGTGKTMTATDSLFQPGHVGSYWEISHRRAASSSVLTGEADASWAAEESTPLLVIGKWDLFTYGTWSGTLQLLAQSPSGIWEVLRSWTSNKDRNIIASGEQLTETNMKLKIIAPYAGEAASGVDKPRFVLEAADSRIYGLVKVTAYVDDEEVTVDIIRSLADTTATTLWSEGAWSDYRGFPAALALHQGRLWFAGNASLPQGLWASVSGDFENFRRSTNDDGSMAVLLASETANPIRWLSSAGATLLAGTGGEEWALNGTTDNGILTPVSLRAERQSSYSSNTVPARLVQDVTMFIQRDGRRIRQLIYDLAKESYSASDLTVLASHVTAGGIVQMAFQQAPTPILWCVTGNGKLIGMTVEREQNVFGWHVHETDGLIESVAVIPGTPSDEVWLLVRRPINGVDRRYIERFVTRGDASEWEQPLVFSDSAVVVNLDEPATTIEGIDHLEGKTVQVLADGAVHGDLVVTGGAIELQAAASQVVAGLQYTSILQPMKREIQLQDGTAQGRTFKLVGATIRVDHSLGGEVSADPDDALQWERVVDRQVGDPMDARPPLFTGEHKLLIESRHGPSLNASVRQTEPLPFNLVAFILNYEVYGP